MAGTDPSAGVQGPAAPSRGVALTPGSSEFSLVTDTEAH